MAETVTFDHWDLDSTAGGSASYSTTQYSLTFSDVVDAVADLGVDDTGSSDVQPTIESNIGNGTLVEFPPGTYRVDDFIEVPGIGGVRSTTGDPGDVTFVSGVQTLQTFLRPSSCDGLLLEGVTIDEGSGFDTSLGGVWGNIAGNFYAKSIRHEGNTDASNRHEVVVNITDASAAGVVVDWVDEGGAAMEDYPSDDLYCYQGPASTGTFQYRDCQFRNTSENGIYASKSPGDNSAVLCSFVNAQPTAVRIMGPNGFVAECDVTIDPGLWTQENQGYEELERAIWTITDDSFAPYANPTIVDCTVTIAATQSAHGREPVAYQAHPNADEGANTIINLRMTVDNTATSVVDANNGSGTVTFDECQVKGDGTDLIDREERDVTFNDGCLENSFRPVENNVTLNNVDTSCPTAGSVFQRAPDNVGRGPANQGRGG